MEIRPIDPTSTPLVFDEMAAVHRNEITEGFLSQFGDKFLSRLYRSISGSSSAFCLGAFEDDRLLGFIVGATDTGRVYKDYARTGGLGTFLTLAPKLFSPARLKRIVETLVYPNKKRSDDLPEPEILNFCVRKETQGTGVGGRLFAALLAEFGRRGVQTIRIVTGESQVSAQQFYEKRGAKLAATTEIHKGTTSRIYVFEVPAGDA
ncbi:MAG: GNAT family N-acetyltransferase [Armatimonadetes bacterium]|nr:GNAT family N-acetyltransferase [Armatimonadota bacterium]